jgi:hypothetical protein
LSWSQSLLGISCLISAHEERALSGKKDQKIITRKTTQCYPVILVKIGIIRVFWKRDAVLGFTFINDDYGVNHSQLVQFAFFNMPKRGHMTETLGDDGNVVG